MKKYFLILGILAIGFVYSRPAHATVIWDTTDPVHGVGTSSTYDLLQNGGAGTINLNQTALANVSVGTTLYVTIWNSSNSGGGPYVNDFYAYSPISTDFCQAGCYFNLGISPVPGRENSSFTVSASYSPITAGSSKIGFQNSQGSVGAYSYTFGGGMVSGQYQPWVCVTTDPTFSDCAFNGPPPPPVSAISINYPVNGTTTALFRNWIVSSTNNTGFPNITIGVKWAGSTSTLENPQSPFSFGNDQLNLNNATGTTVFNFIPTTLYTTAQATTTWYAQAYMQTVGPEIVVVATSTIVQFTINNSLPTIVDNTAWHPGQGFLQPTPTSTGFCYPPDVSPFWDITQWGPGISYGLCSVAQVYFGNQTPGYTFLQNQWTAFQAVPPFNLVFGIASTTENAVSNASSSQQDLSVELPIGTNQATIPVFSSTTLSQLFHTTGNGHNIPACDWTCANAKKDVFLQYEAYVIDAGTFVTTVAIII